MKKLMGVLNLSELRKILYIFVATCLCAITVLAQRILISGTVSDDTGDPLPDASVLVKGTNTGIVTDADGIWIYDAKMKYNRAIGGIQSINNFR